MIFGGWLRKHDMGSSPQRLICAASQWLAVVIVYMASRIIALPAIAPKLSALLPLVLLAPPGCILFAVSSLRLIQTPAVASFLESKVCYTIITFLAVHSWETYLLHSGISHWPMVAHLPSPLALLAVFALTFALAPVLRFVSNLSNFRSKKKI